MKVYYIVVTAVSPCSTCPISSFHARHVQNELAVRPYIIEIMRQIIRQDGINKKAYDSSLLPVIL